jgi:hypothetical protein
MHAISLFDKLSQWHEYLEVSSLLWPICDIPASVGKRFPKMVALTLSFIVFKHGAEGSNDVNHYSCDLYICQGEAYLSTIFIVHWS